MSTEENDNDDWADFFTEYTDRFTGFVTGAEELSRLIDSYEMGTDSAFSVLTETETIHDGVSLKFHKVMWEDVQPCNGVKMVFDGIPFMILGKATLECHHGIKRRRKISDVQLSAASAVADHPYKIKRKTNQASKKLGCPLKIYVRKIVKFPKHKISASVRSEKEKASKRITAACNYKEQKECDDQSSQENADDKTEECIVQCPELRFYVKLPNPDDHKNHLIGEDAYALNPTDKKVRAKVHQLVDMGIQNVMEIKRPVDVYVSNELFKGKAAPSIFNRRFCPTRKDVKNMVYKARLKILKSNNDQENTSILIEQLKNANPDDNFFFRPFNENSNDELLFVHQSSWQRHLLLRYGQCICTLDATYNTTRYALPLFFVCVKSNVGYSVVATFITQHERGDSISEALNMIRSWNHEWQPSSFMMDHSIIQRPK